MFVVSSVVVSYSMLFFFGLGGLFCVVNLLSGCVECLVCIFRLFACSCKWCLKGSVRVSSCRCCMFVSCVLPVVMRSAVFCMICSLFVSVSDMIGDHMVDAYSIMLLVYVLYVWRSVTLCCPHVVPVSAFIIFSVLCAFCLVVCMCWLNVSLGSSVMPMILGLRSVVMFVFAICSVSGLLYSAGSGVSSVDVVLVGLRVRLFCVAHVAICSKYGCICCCAVL